MVSKRTKYLITAAAAATMLYSSSFNVSTVKAEGTRNMVSNGGYRPYTWATDTTTAGITRRTILKIYAKAGEKIYLGSSVSANSVDIIVKDPSGVQTTYDVLSTGKGYIDSTTKETAGPLPNLNGYSPYIIDVNQTGIWQVEFKGDESKTANPTFQPAINDFKATQSGTVASWDITVRDGGGNEVTGRVFTSYISILMGSNLADNTKKVLSSDFYVLTKDGYVYKTGMNGIDPNGFMFFSNNRGFVDKTNNMTLYHSVMDTNSATGDNLGSIIGNVAPQLPNVADTSTDLTHNVFFNYPDRELPGILKPTAIVPAQASGFSFKGADGTDSSAKYSEGGAFTFNSDKQGSYKLIIDANKDGNYDPTTDRVIENVAVKGKNTVVWDGKDAQGNSLPIGAYKAKLTMKGGEYHFPVLDAEYNPFGIKVELLNPPSAFQGGVNKNTVYYNESDYKTANEASVNLNAAASGNGINPISALGGIDSSNGAHKYWYASSSGGYGNWKGIDTWTYFPGNSITLDFNVAAAGTPANGFVSGYIFNDKDKDKIFNSGEPGLNGITVIVTDKNSVVHTTTTDDSGYYAISIPQGTYNLKVTSPSGYTLTTGNASPSGTLSSSTQIINNIGYYVATDVAIIGTASPTQTVLGHEVVYALTITNNGPAAATNVVVNDALPAGIQYVSDNSGGSYDSNTGNLNIGYLAAGQSKSISIVGNINGNLTLPTSITNVATVSLTEPDTNTANNKSSVVISPKANSVPTTTSTIFNGNNDVPLTGNLNGTDADGDTITYSSPTETSKGSITINPDGTFTYTPKPGALGTDTLTVTLSDGHGGISSATITVILNSQPVLNDVSTKTDFNKPVSSKITGTDADGDILTYYKVSEPGKGTVVVNSDGTWTYTPSDGATGDDSFTVKVNDGHGGSAVATITVKIDTPPTVAVGTINVDADFNKPVSGKVEGTDVDKDILTYTVGTVPSNGKVELGADGTWTYTPKDGTTGNDCFTVVVSDGHGGSVIATVTVKIDTPPTVASGTTNIDADFNKPVAGKVDATDADNDALTYTVGTAPSKGKVAVDANGDWTYTPDTGAVGTDSFTIIVSDGHDGSVTKTINVKIDTPPTIAAGDSDAKADFNKPVAGKIDATDADNDTLTYAVGTAPIKGTILVNPDGTWTYTPSTGATGDDSFKVVISDGHGGSVEKTINIKIDTPPTVVNFNAEADFNGLVSGIVMGTDVDKDTLTYAVGTAPNKGTVVVNADGTWTYTPNAGATGDDSFKVVVSDGHGGSVTSTVSVKIDTPPTTSDISTSTDFNKPATGKVEGTDVDNDALTYAIGKAASKGKAELGAGGTWTYTPNTGAVGTDSFKVVVSDGHGGSVTSTVSVKIDTPPTVASATTNTDVDFNKSVAGKVDATDVDKDTLTYTVGAVPSKGTVAVNPDGTWTYTPNTGATGIDSFKVVVSDGHGGSVISTVNVKIDTPPTAADITTATDFNKLVTGKVEGTDVDKDALTYVVGTSPDKGTVVVNADGAWTYTPNTGAVGVDSFTVVVSDGHGGSVTSTVTVKIDTPPTVAAVDITTATDFNKPVTGKVEGTDVDKDTLTYAVGAVPSKGTVVVNADGTWTYTPNTGAVGTDSFTVVVSDGHGGSVISTVNVKIDTPPTAADITTATDFNKQVTGKVEGTDVDKDALTYAVGTAPNKGKVELGADGTWTYTPNTGATGTDSFKVVVSDGHGGSVTSTVNVKIDTPPATADITTATDFNKPVTGRVEGTDVDKDALTYNVGTTPNKGTVAVNPDGLWTYTPNTGASGTDSFTVVVSDGHGGVVTSTIKVRIDVPPTAQDYSNKTDFNKPVSGIVTGADVDGDKLTYSLATSPLKGLATVTADGTWSYIPYNGAAGADSFTVLVNDGHGGTAVSTVKLTIDTPPVVPNYNRVTPYNQSITGIVAAKDVDNDSLSYNLVSNPSNGYVEVDGSGRWTYTPNINYAGTDSFKVSVNDGHGGSTISEISINVKDKVNLVGTITDEETGKIIPNTKIDLYDLRGKLIYSTTTDANGNYNINNVKLGLYEFVVANEKYAKKTVDIDVEPVSETEYTIRKDFKLVNSLSYALKLDANPRTIIGDGKSTSIISARITDKNNNPVANALVVFTAPIGTFPNGTTAITDSNGIARVLFQSAKISGTENKVIPVTATVNDDARNLHASNQIYMTFEPGMITGVVVDNETGLPVSNAVVEVSKDFDGDGIADFYSKMITGADGKYSIAIPKGNVEYNVSITKSVTIGDKTVEVKYNQKSQAGTITGVGGEAFTAEETAAGVILAKQPDGKALFFDDYSKFNIDVVSQADYADVLNGKAKLASISGISASIGNGALDKGVFEAEGLEKGKSYVLALSYTLPSGEKLIVGSVNVCVNADGQINISSALIDPYGTITDAITRGIISGADVKLYYADTARNRAAGRTPNTLVKLPLISGFEPADNNNPQIDDINGKYAFMVFPNADYYVVVSKDGYETYTSETISVGSTIVKKDIEMLAKAKAAASTTNTTNTASTISAVLPKTGSPIDFNTLGILGTVILLSGIGLNLKPKKEDK